MNNDVYDSLPCGVFAFDRDLRITTWNSTLERLLGLSREEMVGTPLHALEFTEIQGNPVDLLKCVTNPEAPGLARSVYAKDGSGKRRLSFIQADFSGGDETIVTLADISEEVTCELISSSDGNPPLSFHGIVGKDEGIREVFHLVRLAAESTANTLITGESGTGKELIARAVHNLSERHNRPFVTVNCSALSETLLESELFGHVKGSFTGAFKDKQGKFEAADGGTIFLDEIGDVSPLIQLKLLRVIQEKTIERVGDNRLIAVDMRIIAATNKDLRDLVAQGLFREDLYYRLKVFPIPAVALRERKGDIPLLAEHFVRQFSDRSGKRIRGVTDDAMRLLMEYCWPGNVRELENTFEYAFVMCRGEMIDVFDLPQELRLTSLRDQVCAAKNDGDNPASELDRPTAARIWKTTTREDLIELLEKNNGNRSATARDLGVSRVTLWKRMKNLGLGSDGSDSPA